MEDTVNEDNEDGAFDTSEPCICFHPSPIISMCNIM